MRLAILRTLALSACVVGCAVGEPFEPPEPGDIPEGPGFFTGEDGAVALSPGGSDDDASSEGSDTSSDGAERGP